MERFVAGDFKTRCDSYVSRKIRDFLALLDRPRRRRRKLVETRQAVGSSVDGDRHHQTDDAKGGGDVERNFHGVSGWDSQNSSNKIPQIVIVAGSEKTSKLHIVTIGDYLKGTRVTWAIIVFVCYLIKRTNRNQRRYGPNYTTMTLWPSSGCLCGDREIKGSCVYDTNTGHTVQTNRKSRSIELYLISRPFWLWHCWSNASFLRQYLNRHQLLVLPRWCCGPFAASLVNLL
jgi:hypothetical protein